MSRTPVFDRGAVVQHEVAFRLYSPHVTTPTYSDPTSATITIVSPAGSYMVASAVLSKSNAASAGLFHYQMQSSLNWAVGIYETRVTAILGFNDTTVIENSFELE